MRTPTLASARTLASDSGLDHAVVGRELAAAGIMPVTIQKFGSQQTPMYAKVKAMKALRQSEAFLIKRFKDERMGHMAAARLIHEGLKSGLYVEEKDFRNWSLGKLNAWGRILRSIPGRHAHQLAALNANNPQRGRDYNAALLEIFEPTIRNLQAVINEAHPWTSKSPTP